MINDNGGRLKEPQNIEWITDINLLNPDRVKGLYSVSYSRGTESGIIYPMFGPIAVQRKVAELEDLGYRCAVTLIELDSRRVQVYDPERDAKGRLIRPAKVEFKEEEQN